MWPMAKVAIVRRVPSRRSTGASTTGKRISQVTSSLNPLASQNALENRAWLGSMVRCRKLELAARISPELDLCPIQASTPVVAHSTAR
jgi:hypothetical protein